MVGAALAIMFGIYFGFTNLSSGPRFFERAEGRELSEYTTYLEGSLKCRSVAITRSTDFMGVRPPQVSRLIQDITVVSEKKVEENLLETVIEGSLDGQLVTFWTRERPQDVTDSGVSSPVIIYLRNSDQYTDYTAKESLLARSELTLIIPYILGEPSSISTMWNSYAYNSVTFQAYVLSKVARVVDYVEAVYDSPKIIAYGEGWGSVLARELAIDDDRIDLVITNKFAGDPYQTILRNGSESKQGLINKLYIKDASACVPSSVGSFGRLGSTPHIYMGPSSFSPFYSLGTRSLAEIMEKRLGSQFTYLELDNLNKTNTEEVIDSINEVLNSQSITN